MTRLDVELHRRGLARSRTLARTLVDEGLVSVDGRPATKPSTEVQESTQISVHPQGADSPHGPHSADGSDGTGGTRMTAGAGAWVGRAALKLAAALAAFGGAADGALQVTGRRALDVGASTGGFTQVMLSAGVSEVVALDVGHGQLHPLVADDPRVTSLEGVNIRGVSAADLGGPFELIVADLSFISLRLVLPVLASLATDDADLVLLVKPQFEVGRERLGHGGVVTSPAEHRRVLLDVLTDARRAGLHLRGLISSPLRGGRGNQEYLLWVASRRVEHDEPALDRLVHDAVQQATAPTAPPPSGGRG